jgi:hypothetical protein
MTYIGGNDSPVSDAYADDRIGSECFNNRLNCINSLFQK